MSSYWRTIFVVLNIIYPCLQTSNIMVIEQGQPRPTEMKFSWELLEYCVIFIGWNWITTKYLWWLLTWPSARCSVTFRRWPQCNSSVCCRPLMFVAAAIFYLVCWIYFWVVSRDNQLLNSRHIKDNWLLCDDILNIIYSYTIFNWMCSNIRLSFLVLFNWHWAIWKWTSGHGIM